MIKPLGMFVLGLMTWAVWASGMGPLAAQSPSAKPAERSPYEYWSEKEPYAFAPGPHLFLDWRYIAPGRVAWLEPDSQQEAKLEGTGLSGGMELARRIGSRPEQLPSGIRIEAQKPQKIGPLLVADQPWETSIGAPCLMKIDDKYRIYYNAEPPSTDPEQKRELLCVAESTDGAHWVKPQLGLVEFGGNMWKETEEPLMVHCSDTQTIAYYDEVLKRYVGYFRAQILDRRAIGRSETADYRNWPAPETVLWPNPADEPSEDYYKNGHALYPGTLTEHYDVRLDL